MPVAKKVFRTIFLCPSRPTYAHAVWLELKCKDKQDRGRHQLLSKSLSQLFFAVSAYLGLPCLACRPAQDKLSGGRSQRRLESRVCTAVRGAFFTRPIFCSRILAWEYFTKPILKTFREAEEGSSLECALLQ